MQILRTIQNLLGQRSTPVDSEFAARLERASKQAGEAMGHKAPLPYILQINRKNVAVLPKHPVSTGDCIRRLIHRIHGPAVATTLYQPDAWGFIGPFAKVRKRNRRQSPDVTENALLFWPTDKGNISPIHTRYVLKAAVGRNNHASEIRMLREVYAASGAAPEIHASDPDLQWLVMEYVSGSDTLSAEHQARVYLERISEPFFHHFGVETAPAINLTMSETKDPGNVRSINNLQESAAALGIDDFQALMQGTLSWSQTHGGGICEEVTLTEKGRACLLDWEKAAFAPIADDLLQVFQYHPRQTVELFDRLRAEDTLTAKDQLAISLVFRHALRRAKKKPNQKLLAADRQCAEMLKYTGRITPA